MGGSFNGSPESAPDLNQSDPVPRGQKLPKECFCEAEVLSLHECWPICVCLNSRFPKPQPRSFSYILTEQLTHCPHAAW